MSKAILIFAFCILQFIGCARVRVEAPKEPIRVDVSMRLDIYQHIQKDIDDIESIVSGTKEEAKPKNSQSQINYFLDLAYAQDDLGPEVEQAALRRKDRRLELISWQQKGIIGENHLGLVELVNKQGESRSEELVRSENSDRMIIYQVVAKKNSSSIEEVQRLYAQRLQSDAPSGVPIEVINATTGRSEWKTK